MLKNILISLFLMGFTQISMAGKIVVFDHEEAMVKTNIATQKIEALKAKPEYAQLLANFESLKADLEALSKDANTKGMTWSEEEKNDQLKKRDYIQADLKLAAQKLQAEHKAAMEGIFNELAPKLDKVLGDLIKSGDYDLILRRQVIYRSKENADITDQVTEALNKAK